MTEAGGAGHVPADAPADDRTHRTQRRPGAHPDADGTTFVAWSTTTTDVAVRLFAEDGKTALRTASLEPRGEGFFAAHLPGVKAGALYKLVVGGDETPDPYARFMPFGVHGPARVVARASEPALAEPLPLSQWVIYELHVGTFSPEGTYRGAEARLDALVDLGISAIELLPLASFPGARGWGYDGVALYAPHAAYGEPDELRSLVRAAHARGLAVILDAVYNHFGPDGNYLWKLSPAYFTKAVETPWGPAPDFAHAPMRSLAVENARYWMEEFGFDGLRLDATHAIHDASPRHVLRELTELAHAMTPPRRIFFEDERNEPDVMLGLGADGVWADDFHHHVHTLLTGERDGYYAAYEPTLAALARAINEGWSFTGQPFPPWNGKARGTSLRECERETLPEQLVYCLQNHDQIGNRALGTRLTEHVAEDAYLAASVLLLFLPATPLLFMGQEWAASSPFLFFTDHEGELGEAVRKGRREEFKAFAAFADPAVRDAIPDPQAPSTFEQSKLPWNEATEGMHRRVHETYRAMLRLRRSDPVLSASCRWEDFEARVVGEVLEVVRRHGADVRRLLVGVGPSAQAVDVPEDAPVLFVSGRFEGGKLGRASAVVLAR